MVFVKVLISSRYQLMYFLQFNLSFLLKFGSNLASCQLVPFATQSSYQQYRVTKIKGGPAYRTVIWLQHWGDMGKQNYCQTSSIICTITGNKFVDHSDVVGASPVALIVTCINNLFTVPSQGWGSSSH